VAGSVARPAEQLPPDPAFESLAELTTTKMREHHVPGVALGVLRDGRVTIRGFGVRSAEDTLPVTSDTIFPLASISKTVTTTTMVRLVGTGNVELEATAKQYLS